jgi:nucleoside-diphosphate-sugar epimerase
MHPGSSRALRVNGLNEDSVDRQFRADRRAIFGALAAAHEVGLDRSPFATTPHHCRCHRSPGGHVRCRADAVIHTAPARPHVGLVPDAVFQQINVEATARTCCRPPARPVHGRFVLTSTTALYGHAVVAGGCRWIDEDTEPLPRTIYHRSKLQAETLAEAARRRASACACCAWAAASPSRRSGWRCSACIAASTPRRGQRTCRAAAR